MKLAEKIRAQILNGSLADHDGILAGYCRGFYVSLAMDMQNFYITVNCSKENDPGNAALSSFLEQTRMSNKKHIIALSVLPYRFTLTVREPELPKNSPKRINGVMEPILNYLALNAYGSGCGCCGESAKQLGLWQINGESVYLCDDCAGEVERGLAENQAEVKSQKSNLIAGLVGAFLGSLIGVVLWVIIGKLGYISGIAGLVMGICTMKGYELLGKHLDKKGVIFCIIMMVVMVFIANKLTWSLSAYSELKDYEWTFGEVFRNLGYILSESGLMGSFLTDLGIGYLLTALASFSAIRNAFRASNGSYKIKKFQ